MKRQGNRKSRRWGDKETGRQGDRETRRRTDRGTERRRDRETDSAKIRSVAPSLCPSVSPSLRLSVSLSLCLFLFLWFVPLIAKAQTGAITGRVITEDGGGLANVTVMLLPVNPNQRSSTRQFSAITDEEGGFKFTGVPSLTYTVH